MESLAKVKEREKVGIEGLMIGEGTVRGREIEKEGTQGRGSKVKIMVDGRGRRKGGGLVHVLDQEAEIGIIIAATNNLEAETDPGRDIIDISVHSYVISYYYTCYVSSS